MTAHHFVWRYTHIGDAIYPLVPVRFLHGDVRTPPIQGLLDSGSDRVLIPLGLARFLGLRLRRMHRSLRTIGGLVPCFRASVDLIIGDGRRSAMYKDLVITVIDRQTGPVLLGRHPIFRDSIVTFDERAEEIRLGLTRRT